MAAADRLARGGGQRRATLGGLPGFLLDRTPAGRRLVYRQARAQVLKKTGGHYPAPLAALEAVRVGLEHGVAAGLAEEHRAFGQLAVGDVCRKLVQIFFATTALKKDDGVPPGSGSPGRSAGSAWWARASWASGIAGTAVLNVEVDTRLKDADLPRVGKGIRAAARYPGRAAQAPPAHPAPARAAAARCSRGATTTAGFARADLVIEAVFEDLELKRRVLAEVGAADPAGLPSSPPTPRPSRSARSPPSAGAPGARARHALLLPGREDAAARGHPDRRPPAPSIVTAVRFGRRMGKTVIVVARPSRASGSTASCRPT